MGQHAKLYATKRWRTSRLRYLAEHPVCVPCEAAGRVAVATVVDHVQPHQGELTLFWDRDNWQASCATCHNRKTATRDTDSRFGEFKRFPDFILSSTMPVTIVCGAPGSGKTTYANAQRRPRSLLIDFDVIAAELSGLAMHTAPMDRWLAPTMRERNRLLAGLHRDARHREAWLTIGAPKCEERRRWRALLGNARVVVMETDAMICEQRLREQVGRWDQQGAIEAAYRWWSRYSADPARDRVELFV